MDRRHFSRTLGTTLGALALFPEALSSSFPGTWRRFGEQPLINGPRLHEWLRQLSRFGRRADGGVDRVAFSDADIQGREFFRSLMEETGLEVRVDLVGNLIGRLRGSDPNLPPLMMGSHLDSVPAGGNYDGPLGTLGALEGARTLQDAGVVPRHPVDVVAFVNEEGGKTGSRVLAGEFRKEELQLVSSSGFSIGEGIRRLGGDPDRLDEARLERGSMAGFLELHVEQGAILEGKGVPIGVVEGIVGIRRWTAVVNGAANHAGTTPMDQRRDAMIGAAQLVEAVNRVVTSIPGSQVATVGRIQASPGAPNVIPGEVRMSIEIRALEMDRIQEVMDGIQIEAEAIGYKNGTPIDMDEFYLSRGAPTDIRFRGWVEAAAGELGLDHQRMPSGAGHDAQAVAHFAPMGMVFIPSVGGLSHHPDEYSRPEDIEAGANVLLGALLKADEALD
ncbi:MAG: Zn-dependent hydrolase [Gemmatimonadetes bacterium]|nr:Zn-dependent hydrolase [Gemmatimonadota bacterium]NNM06177.1 Zn-dependent hydrolase [Gemmatimonadota bacterium]